MGPKHLTSLPSLSTLDVYNNQLTILPPGLLKCPHLVRCDLVLNPLVSMGADCQYGRLTKDTKIINKLVESLTEDIEITNDPIESTVDVKQVPEVTEKQLGRDEDQFLSRVLMLLAGLRTWDGRLGEEFIIEGEVFKDRNQLSLEIRETEDHLEDLESDYNECCTCYSVCCQCEFNKDEERGGEEADADSSKEVVRCEESSSNGWEDCGVYSPTKLDVKHNLSRMHLEQFWGFDQFCPADLHHLPMIDQLTSKWEKAYLLKAAQQVGRKRLEVNSLHDIIQEDQFEDAD